MITKTRKQIKGRVYNLMRKYKANPNLPGAHILSILEQPAVKSRPRNFKNKTSTISIKKQLLKSSLTIIQEESF